MLDIFLLIIRSTRMLFTMANETEGIFKALAIAHLAAMNRKHTSFCWYENNPWIGQCNFGLLVDGYMEKGIEEPEHHWPEAREAGTGPPNVCEIPSLATTSEAPVTIGRIQIRFPGRNPVAPLKDFICSFLGSRLEGALSNRGPGFGQ